MNRYDIALGKVPPYPIYSYKPVRIHGGIWERNQQLILATMTESFHPRPSPDPCPAFLLEPAS